MVCFKVRESFTFEATYTFSEPFGPLACSTADIALTNHCRCVSTSFPVLALLELSRGQWFKGENRDAIGQPILTAALSQLGL